MSSYFRKTRNCELSTLEYLKQRIENSWSGVTIVKSFTQAYDATVPVVCIRLDETMTNKLEIGSTTYNHTYSIIVDIFAKSDGQRLDLSDFILNQINGTWTYSDYSHSSDNSSVVATPNGKMQMVAITENRKVEVFENPESQDRFRHIIGFLCKKF